MKRNPVFLIGIFLSLTMGFFLTKKRPEERQWYWMTVIAALIVIFFPNKRPFFLYIFVPVFAISCALLLEHLKKLSERWNIEKWFFAVPIVLGIAIFVSGSKYFLLLNKDNRNTVQRVLMTKTEKFLYAHSAGRYYDGFGVLPRYRFLAGFIGPEQKHANYSNVKSAVETKPEIVFYTGKLALLRHRVIPFLLESYTPLGHNVWARAIAIDVSKIADGTVKRGSKVFRVLSASQLASQLPKDADWKFLSASYHPEKTHPEFKALFVKTVNGETIPFGGSIELKNLSALLVPEKVKEIRVSRFPMFRAGVHGGFNSEFLFDFHH